MMFEKGGIDMTPPNGTEPVVLEARGIVKELGGNTVLNHVDLTLAKGDLKVLIGPSGSGNQLCCSA